MENGRLSVCFFNDMKRPFGSQVEFEPQTRGSFVSECPRPNLTIRVCEFSNLNFCWRENLRFGSDTTKKIFFPSGISLIALSSIVYASVCCVQATPNLNLIPAE